MTEVIRIINNMKLSSDFEIFENGLVKDEIVFYMLRANDINFLLSIDYEYTNVSKVKIWKTDQIIINNENWLLLLFPNLKTLQIIDQDFPYKLNIHNVYLDYFLCNYILSPDEIINCYEFCIKIHKNYNFDFLINISQQLPSIIDINYASNLNIYFLKSILNSVFQKTNAIIIVDEIALINKLLSYDNILGESKYKTFQFSRRRLNKNDVIYNNYKLVQINTLPFLERVLCELRNNKILFFIDFPINDVIFNDENLFLNLKSVIIIFHNIDFYNYSHCHIFSKLLRLFNLKKCFFLNCKILKYDIITYSEYSTKFKFINCEAVGNFRDFTNHIYLTIYRYFNCLQ
ncbi:hypothetical protein SGHV054 [Glossina pallidipes salivary gland hypertrophy virus]|uniref:Uncharacterized protein n=1 Tax=Glossina hytrovirus (isolate Glossina pallidipes/Ethiopia/Seibersdorf/-) TaxID=379529 RepID=B0YLK8_GHVS|nr:hypothetical protein SGHV054 [Glossina pallidipes salivary gland hypertrophy virus]ABQ08827.1 hypothetical protein SGHV054 [Glossina pallidipes salivary gland hypertrophy virus]